MSETITEKPTKEEIAAAVERFMEESNAEKRLYELLEKLPGKRVVYGSNGDTVVIEQQYDRGRCRVVREVMDLRGV